MEMIRESGNGRTGRGALSDPDRLKPVPAALSLSGRRDLAGVRIGQRRVIGLIGIARREVTERRDYVVSAIPGDGT